MNVRAEEDAQSTMDTVKLGTALVLLSGAIVAFYYYADISRLYRVLGLVAVAGVSIFISLQTEKGRMVLSFLRESQIEVRKVVWPTWQETYQTTFIVLIVVLLVALFLWGLDSLLGAIMQFMMG